MQALSSPSLPSQSPHSLLPRLATENKSEDEKIKTWESIVKKVDKKFTERVEAVADAVREWWRAYVNKEIREVNDMIAVRFVRSHHW